MSLCNLHISTLDGTSSDLRSKRLSELDSELRAETLRSSLGSQGVLTRLGWGWVRASEIKSKGLYSLRIQSLESEGEGFLECRASADVKTRPLSWVNGKSSCESCFWTARLRSALNMAPRGLGPLEVP